MASSSKTNTTWTFERDVLLAREILIGRPYQFKKGTKESGNVWANVIKILNEKKDVRFNVTVKSARDHFNLVVAKREKKLREEETATGGGDVESTELDVLLDEIKNDMERCQNMYADKKSEDEEKRAKGEEMRQVAMESMSATKRRNSSESENGTPPSKQRRTAGDTLQYLNEKNKLSKEIEEERLKLEREKLDVRRLEAENTRLQHDGMMMQMQQQFQMQQNFMLQQSELMRSLIEKLQK